VHHRFKAHAHAFGGCPPPWAWRAFTGPWIKVVCDVDHDDESVLEYLEEYQRDLEQELADLAGRIKRIKERQKTS
jgi:hypothetical protein